MPLYKVHVTKTEEVILSANIEVEAENEEAARADVQKQIDDCDIDDSLWYEQDTKNNEDEEITAVDLVEDDEDEDAE